MGQHGSFLKVGATFSNLEKLPKNSSKPNCVNFTLFLK